MKKFVASNTPSTLHSLVASPGQVLIKLYNVDQYLFCIHCNLGQEYTVLHSLITVIVIKGI